MSELQAPVLRATANNPIDLTGAKILLVDDTPANLEVLCELLRAHNYKIFMADSGPQALKIVERAQPDLILLDVMMPGMDGYEVCKKLKSNPNTEPIPVIFITANDQTEGLVASFEAGGGDYIPKPFRDAEVVMRVRNALYSKYLFDQNLAYQQKMENELQTAHDLQMGFMPTANPQLPGYDIAGRCMPAEQVGGDLYQYFEQDGILSLSLADVTGHAMAAAIPVVLFKGLLESHMELGLTLSELFAKLNQLLHRILNDRTFVCFTMGQLDASSRTLYLLNCGCPYPLHYRARDGQISELKSENYPLGIRLDTDYAPLEIHLESGDRVIFQSDGVIETINEQEELFGEERLIAILSRGCADGRKAEALLDLIVDEVRTFSDTVSQGDDQTLVVLSVE